MHPTPGDTLSEHLHRPRNRGKNVQPVTGRGIETRPQSGDAVRISLHVLDGQVKEAKWLAFGCPLVGAAASLVTEYVADQPVRVAETVDAAGVMATFGLPAHYRHCADMVVNALRRALENHYLRHGRPHERSEPT